MTGSGVDHGSRWSLQWLVASGWKLRVAAILEWHAAASKLIHDPDREGAQLPVAGLHDARPVLARPFFYVKNGGEDGILLGCFFVSCISLIWSALQDSLHLGRLRGVAEVQLLLVRIFSSHEPEKAKLNPTNSHGVVITRRAPAKELPHPVFEAETRPQNHVKFSHYFFSDSVFSIELRLLEAPSNTKMRV